MKVIELEINNVRGICHLPLKPNGKNFVVWGPNGSGKSAVVDAIDFLLTGKISRLTGEGTGGITLSKHGPHIDHKPKDAVVRAILQIPGLKKPVEIKRCMAHPNALEYDESVANFIEPIILLAQRGQHVLTRRDILRFIAAEASTRAHQIQELLNITKIEEIRKTFVSVQNKLGDECKAEKKAVDRAKDAINVIVQEKTFSEGTVLKFVNQNRAVLGGQHISTFSSTELKRKLAPPVGAPSAQPINLTLLEKSIQNLLSLALPQNQDVVAKSDKLLRESIDTIRRDPNLSRALLRLQLTELGMNLIDDTGSCPLCDTPWLPGKLREYLEQKISLAKVAEQHRAKITKLSESIASAVNSTMETLKIVISAAQAVELKSELSLLKSWFGDLQALLKVLDACLDKYPDSRFGSDSTKQMLAPFNVEDTFEHVQRAAKGKYPVATPQQNAWDMLTRLEENMKALEGAENMFRKAELSEKRASLLLSSFVAARDSVLTKLYDAIGDRFVYLYRQLHRLDEGNFEAKIEPEEAGLNFEVDFYGRGKYPPLALHSEGHQDSMGLCLYFALSENLTQGLIDLVILDDVVMSVDAEHRREVCHLLETCFPNRQFLITTHDRTWANQLKSAGIVDKQGIVEFYNWHVETGPCVCYQVDMWDRVEDDLQKNDIPSAAARLRRGCGEFFAEVCDVLEARVVYRLNGPHELGDLLPAAIGRYSELLGQAKKAANSWGDNNCLDMLKELDSTKAQIYKRTSAEQWAVNASVHYNNWANLSDKDFRPVVEAFHDLYGLFTCTECGSMLGLVVSGVTPMAVRCSCGKVNWNLMEKGKAN